MLGLPCENEGGRIRGYNDADLNVHRTCWERTTSEYISYS